ncbi:unnamed protein product, partial [Allacma fusca]
AETTYDHVNPPPMAAREDFDALPENNVDLHIDDEANIEPDIETRAGKAMRARTMRWFLQNV